MGGILPDARWHHAGFSVRDLDSAIAFYTDVFGFVLEFRTYIEPIDTHLCFLKRDDTRFEIFQMPASSAVPEHRLTPNTDLSVQGTKHPCFSVSDCQEALEIMARRPDVMIVGVVRRPGDPMVLEEDFRLRPGDPRPPAAAFFFRDPCDLLVEVVLASSFTPDAKPAMK